MRLYAKIVSGGVDMLIKRDGYLNKLISKKWNGMIKVITGIRRCGKSYLLFELFKNHLKDNGVENDQIIEIIDPFYYNVAVDLDYRYSPVPFEEIKKYYQDCLNQGLLEPIPEKRR